MNTEERKNLILKGIKTVTRSDPYEFLGECWIQCQGHKEPALIVLKSRHATIDQMRKTKVEKRNDQKQFAAQPNCDSEPEARFNNQSELAFLIENAHLSQAEMVILYDEYYGLGKKPSVTDVQKIILKIQQENPKC